jgi:hypothetical protein
LDCGNAGGKDAWLPTKTSASQKRAGRPYGSVIRAALLNAVGWGCFRTSMEETSLTVEVLDLVVQWGPEREWDWETIGDVTLPPASRRDSALDN